MTIADFIDEKSREKLNGIIETINEAEQKAKEAEHKAWLKQQEVHKKYVEATHFKTPQEMISWVMSGKSIYNEWGDEMKVNDDHTHVGHYGQHGNGYDDCTFWYGWKWVSTDEWIAWVDRISQPDHLEYGYIPAWGKIKKSTYLNENNIAE